MIRQTKGEKIFNIINIIILCALGGHYGLPLLARIVCFFE